MRVSPGFGEGERTQQQLTPQKQKCAHRRKKNKNVTRAKRAAAIDTPTAVHTFAGQLGQQLGQLGLVGAVVRQQLGQRVAQHVRLHLASDRRVPALARPQPQPTSRTKKATRATPVGRRTKRADRGKQKTGKTSGGISTGMEGEGFQGKTRERPCSSEGLEVAGERLRGRERENRQTDRQTTRETSLQDVEMFNRRLLPHIYVPVQAVPVAIQGMRPTATLRRNISDQRVNSFTPDQHA